MSWTFYTKYGTSLEQGKTPMRPAGTMVYFPHSSVPSGWLRADGSVVLRASYPDLFDAIQTLYNTGGETSLQFRLPNVANRMVPGPGATVGSVSSSGGAATHGHTSVVYAGHSVPSHTHGMPSHSHTTAAHEHNANHSHGPNTLGTSDNTSEVPASPWSGTAGTGRLSTFVTHSHNINTDVATAGVDTTGFSAHNTSSSDAYSTNGPETAVTMAARSGAIDDANQLPPYRSLYVIIKT